MTGLYLTGTLVFVFAATLISGVISYIFGEKKGSEDCEEEIKSYVDKIAELEKELQASEEESIQESNLLHDEIIKITTELNKLKAVRSTAKKAPAKKVTAKKTTAKKTVAKKK